VNRSRIAVICNPLSGRVRRRPGVVDGLRAAVSEGAYREARTPEEVSAVVRELVVEAGYEALVVIGGDGTTQAVLTSLHLMVPDGRWPQLIPLPGGSTNMTALDAGAGGTLAAGIAKLQRWLDDSNARESRVSRPVLLVERSGHPEVCGMFFGTATVAEGVLFFRRRLRGVGAPSERTSLFSILRMLLALARDGAAGSCRVWARVGDGEPTEQTATVCLAGTLDRFLLGMRPYWGGEDAPIHFTLVTQEAQAFWRSLWRLVKGRPGTRLTPERGYLSHNAHRVELAFDGPFVVDGEIFEADAGDGPLRLSAPRTVEWLVPQ
jgi:diacylglycerol kinase (ATP)